MAEETKAGKLSGKPVSGQEQRDQEMADMRLKFDENQERLRASLKKKIIAEHTLAANETLSHISLKYYGSAAKPYWMLIYEANKAVIGDNPNHVRAGLVLKIPELPADMKKG
jgi:nucleoid-associated protein YgaU